MQLNCINSSRTCEHVRVPDNCPHPSAERIAAGHSCAHSHPGPPIEVWPSGFPRRSLAAKKNTGFQPGNGISNPPHPAEQGNRTCGAGNRRGVEILRTCPLPGKLPRKPPPLRVQKVRAHELPPGANHALRRSTGGCCGGGQTVRRVRHLCRVCRLWRSGKATITAFPHPYFVGLPLLRPNFTHPTSGSGDVAPAILCATASDTRFGTAGPLPC